MLGDGLPEEQRDTVFVIAPNASLSARQAQWFLGLMFLVVVGSGLAWALAGYWLVLPFSGLEFVALWVGLTWSMSDNDYREVISFDGDELAIEKGHRKPQHCQQFLRAWARVEVEIGHHSTSPTRLVITASGRRCELGACLTDGEREALAARLRRLTGSAPAAVG